MTPREKVIAVVNGKIIDEVVIFGETPMDITVYKELFPDYKDWVENEIFKARFFNNAAVGVGIRLTCDTLSKDEFHHRYRYETGAVWHEQYKPVFNRKAESFPINNPEDVFEYIFPDPDKPGRIDTEAIRKAIEKFHKEGLFVQGEIFGAWQGIYYFLTSFDNILMWMIVEPDVAQKLFEMTINYSVACGKKLLNLGVDGLYTSSDFGSSNSLLFSPELFDKYIYNWLKTLANMCHSRGKILHLHSHGHIGRLMDRIIEAGVDIINPIGPGDNNDLNKFKKIWGSKIVLHGGISTTINDMEDNDIRKHVKDVIDVGRKGGRFFPRTESGIPLISKEKLKVYIEALNENCRLGYKPLTNV